MKKAAHPFISGAMAMLPLAPGIFPFGLIFGTVASGAGLKIYETMGMNVLVLAGASQLAAIELLKQDASVLVVVLTGLVINLRFIMYSTSLAPEMSQVAPMKRLGLAYLLTDQSFAVTLGSGYQQLSKTSDRVLFYSGAALLMYLIWHTGTVAGAIFGNVAPKSWSLEFAVPLTFMALVLPTLKSRLLVIVAATSATISVLAVDLPFNLGLITAATLSLGVGVSLQRIFKRW